MRRRIIRSLREQHVTDRTARWKPAAHDTGWAGNARSAVGCALLLLALLLAMDAGIGTINGPRGALWTALAVLLFLVLWPPRATAGPGWLALRGLLGERRVRTDRLTSVRWFDGVSQRLVLRDEDGGRIEIDPQVLVANPVMWRLLDADARASMAAGTLLCGSTALRQLSERIDRETARTVFKISGLEQPERATRAGRGWGVGWAGGEEPVHPFDSPRGQRPCRRRVHRSAGRARPVLPHGGASIRGCRAPAA